MNERVVLSVTGDDKIPFLQNLVTNDVDRATDGIVYAALLTPQGKFIADFFIVGDDEQLLIDVAASHAPSLAQKLTMYRLRAAVQIAETEIIVSRGTGPVPDGAMPDPRNPAMGWRFYGAEDRSDDTDWDALRVAHIIPKTGIELTPDSYLLECGFERLNGIDFKKGCYVGQEINARMKHKTELRKGLVKVTIDGAAPVGTRILTGDGKEAGTLFTQSGKAALAHLRFDRAKGTLQAGDADITADL
ncbi:YgfZ/GcvT domain-containing protein [Loktanella agnita]|uniref:CAF17-like 4Fe-4S cluster assembly/insertion protein YgfZ n=1 Tax=Loktanella agnita TaxID=287097 RepID=UPI003987C22A